MPQTQPMMQTTTPWTGRLRMKWASSPKAGPTSSMATPAMQRARWVVVVGVWWVLQGLGLHQVDGMVFGLVIVVGHCTTTSESGMGELGKGWHTSSTATLLCRGQGGLSGALLHVYEDE